MNFTSESLLSFISDERSSVSSFYTLSRNKVLHHSNTSECFGNFCGLVKQKTAEARWKDLRAFLPASFKRFGSVHPHGRDIDRVTPEIPVNHNIARCARFPYPHDVL